MTRRRAVRLRKAANLYHRHYNAWRCAHGWRDCRAFVQRDCVTYEDGLHEGTADVRYSSHAGLLQLTANIRRRRVLSLGELRALALNAAPRSTEDW